MRVFGLSLTLVVCCIYLCGALNSLPHEQSVIDKNIIATVNSHPKSTWTAGVNENLIGMSVEQLKRSMLGWVRPSAEEKARPLPVSQRARVASVPSTFVSASNWPHCKTIGTIYNQARCGSCWAFGGVEAASDRFCIASNGTFNEILSFAQVTECCSGGCFGGSAEATWGFIQENGIVKGSCYPYYIPTCSPSEQPCLNFVNTPNCWSNNSCVDGGEWKTYNVRDVYSLDSVEDAQQDIMTHGPIEACFDVYADFVHYKSGVYRHTTGQFLGGHCVKIQGWGVENGTPYWLVNNQWTTSWGDNGQFKILRGSDECGIEDDLVAGHPAI